MMDTMIIGNLIAIAIQSLFISLALFGIWLDYRDKKNRDGDSGKA